MTEVVIAVLSAAACVYLASATAKLRGRSAYLSFQAGLAETRLISRRLLPPAAAALAACEAVVAVSAGDPAKEVELGLAHDGAAEHRRRDVGSMRRKTPSDSSWAKSSSTEPRLGHGLHLDRGALQEVRKERVRLLEPAVHPPGVARPDPANGRGRDALLEEPHAGVERGLASADDHETLGRVARGERARPASRSGHRRPSRRVEGSSPGTSPSMYVVSTSLRRTRTCHDAPVSRETKRCSPT